MEVVLLILKIIGIVLLSVIGLAFLLSLLMMLWPFSYRIKAFKDAEKFDIAVRILWLLGLVTATVNYNKEAWIKVRVLGIPVYKFRIWPTEEKASGDDEEAAVLSEENSDTKETDAENSDTSDNIAVQENKTDLTDDYVSENEYFDDSFEESEMLSDEDLDKEIEEMLNDDSDETFEKLPFLKKVKAFIEKIKEFILKCRQKCYNIKDSIQQSVEKAKRIYKDIRFYVKLIQHPSVKPALKKVWKNVKKMLRHVRPRHIKANIEFGSGDPASTMKVYGYYCMIYPFYGKKIKFIPDMENKVLNLDVKISGHFQMLQMMLVGWSLFTDRHIRRIYRIIRRKQEGKKRGRK